MGSSVLHPAEIEALHLALDDEHRALATYAQVIDDFGAVRPFVNIIASEARHIAALGRIFKRYGVPLPTNPWIGRTPRFATVFEACQAGVAGEIDNERLYHRLLAAVRRPDIRHVFERLRDASQQRHLPAFQRCVRRWRDGKACQRRRHAQHQERT